MACAIALTLFLPGVVAGESVLDDRLSFSLGGELSSYSRDQQVRLALPRVVSIDSASAVTFAVSVLSGAYSAFVDIVADRDESGAVNMYIENE